MQRIPFLIISDYEIVNPSTLSFSDFGFPVDILTPTQEMTGTVGGATRTCRNTFGGKAADIEVLLK